MENRAEKPGRRTSAAAQQAQHAFRRVARSAGACSDHDANPATLPHGSHPRQPTHPPFLARLPPPGCSASPLRVLTCTMGFLALSSMAGADAGRLLLGRAAAGGGAGSDAVRGGGGGGASAASAASSAAPAAAAVPVPLPLLRAAGASPACCGSLAALPAPPAGRSTARLWKRFELWPLLHSKC